MFFLPKTLLCLCFYTFLYIWRNTQYHSFSRHDARRRFNRVRDARAAADTHPQRKWLAGTRSAAGGGGGRRPRQARPGPPRVSAVPASRGPRRPARVPGGRRRGARHHLERRRPRAPGLCGRSVFATPTIGSHCTLPSGSVRRWP